MRRAVWINLIVGIWLIIAPFGLSAAGVANAWAVNDIALGILLIVLSWWMLGALTAPAGAAWFEVVCGIWLIIAPFVLGYQGTRAAMSNNAICGIIVIIVAAATALALTKTGRPTPA
jgi:hypothetical protein